MAVYNADNTESALGLNESPEEKQGAIQPISLKRRSINPRHKDKQQQNRTCCDRAAAP